MKILFDFFPIALFFISYKLFGIYYATFVAITTSFLQVVFFRIKYKKYEKMHIINFAILFFLGGSTLVFQDASFIKWKPTGIYWTMSIILISSFFFGDKPAIQKMLDKYISMPNKIWNRLNLAWALFFLTLGGINLYIAYNYNTDTWVNFKLFGTLGFTLCFIIIQNLCLGKYLTGKAIK